MRKPVAPERTPAEYAQRPKWRRWQTGLMLATCLVLSLSLSGGSVRAALNATTLTVSNPYCVQSEAANGACVIKIRSIYATSTDPLFGHVEISINGKVRAYLSSFFEQSIYMNSAMLGDGLQVACGLPGASGLATYGKTYQVGISAYTTGSSPIVDIAVVNCPYYISKSYLPGVRK